MKSKSVASKTFRVRVRETVLCEYDIDAVDAAAAKKQVAYSQRPLPNRHELDTIDWDVESVKKIK